MQAKIDCTDDEAPETDEPLDEYDEELTDEFDDELLAAGLTDVLWYPVDADA